MEILFYNLLMVIFFVILTPFCTKIISRTGIKHAIAISIPFYIMYILGFEILDSNPWLFFVLPALIAAKNIFYNISYHLNFLEHEDADKREKEVSVLVSLPLIASLLSPLFGGFIIYYFGYSYLYIIGAIILSASIIPLLLTKDVKEVPRFQIKEAYRDIYRKENRSSTLSFMGYATAMTIGMVLWPLFLTTVNISTASIGSIVSISAILTIIVFEFLKKKNAGKQEEAQKEIRRRTIAHTIGWIGRIFADTVFLAFLVDAYKQIAFKMLQVPWTTYIYGIAKKKDYFRFIVSTELTFNFSRIIFIPMLMIFFYLGYYPFALSFMLAAVLSLSYSYILKTK